MASHATFGMPTGNPAAPLYQHIKNVICDKLSAGEWAAGQRLPSENELVDTLGVSRMTIHRALRELTQEGLLTRVHGVGTFIAEARRHASLIELSDIADEIRAEGRQHASRVLMFKTEKANADIAAKMELSTADPVFHLLAVHMRDGVPIQLEDRYVNPAMAPEFMEQDFITGTATHYLIGLYRPDELEHIVQAILPDAKTIKSLALGTPEPCLKLSRRTWKDGKVVTSASLIYPGSRYDLGARYSSDAFVRR